ncbi:MAG: putative 3-hydroxybutyryl-CoA dehydrogenase [Smithella sp. PtaU1.Bin162]|nr:MAG: putative 3-hydroxybutyryl-CoA dehydrogenase [Smithella sp. PtaU1.Bin162]
MKITKVAVIGAGSMGRGIAQVSAQAGYQVALYDMNREALKQAFANIENMLGKAIERKKITEQQKADTLKRILTPASLKEACEDAQLIVEAVFENLEIKKKMFSELDSLASDNAILATNTSSLPITAIAAATKKPSRVIGIHFMNPVPLMKGVEVIPGLATSPDVTNAAMQFVESLGKIPAKAVDYPGFIASRILDVMLNEAVYAVMDGNDPADVDKAMKVCLNFPMGPLELIDLAGLDILLNVMETMQKELGDKYKPAPLLTKMVRAGYLGRKTGRGFFEYK